MNDDTKPAVLIDVDGVLNTFFPCNKPRPACSCHPGWTRVWARPTDTGGRRFKLTLNPDHGPWLLDLASRTGAELVWGTTWQGQANQWVSPTLGLPEDLSHVPIPRQFGRRYSTGQWKAQRAALWSGGRPFVWFDDEPDLPAALTDPEVLEGLPPVGEHLVITVDERVGLTEEHLDEAAAWLGALTAA